jgi:putative ABC transport system permease protein
MNDLKFALRQLRKSPAFSFVAVLTLALGIGANVAIFSVVNTVLLRPFAFSQPSRLVWISSQLPVNPRAPFSLPEFCDYRDQNTLFEGLAAVGSYNGNLVDSGEPERVQGLRLSANIFQLIGLHPFRGRAFIAEDDALNAAPVAMISYGLWSRRYAKENVVGRSVNLNGEPRTIVGVLPPDFALPNFESDVVVPLQPEGDPRRTLRTSVHFLRFVGRLKPGVTLAQGRAELDAIRQDIGRKFPEGNVGSTGVTVVQLGEEIVGNVRPMLITILSAVAALLLIACANLASLSLARAARRQRDLAVRAALGAARSQLVRLLFTESAVVAVLGSLMGFVLALWGSDILVRFVPADLPRANDVTMDARVLLFTATITIVVTFICGLAPAWLLSRADLRDALASGRGEVGINAQSRVRRILVTGQVGLALVLLASAGLFLRSFAQLTRENPGFDSQGILTVQLSLSTDSYPDRASVVRLVDRLLPRLASIPGVESAGLVSLLPLGGGHSSINFTLPDRPPSKREDTPRGNYRIITPGYISAMRIPLLSGRDFTEQDDANRTAVALISASLARKLFSDRSPLRQRLLIDDSDNGPRPVQIVGVIGDVKQEKLEVQPTFDIYLPWRQVIPDALPWLRSTSFLVLRSNMTPMSLETAARNEIRDLDPTIPTTNIRSMEQVMGGAVAGRRFSLSLVAVFALTALLLAAAALYAVIAYGIEQRTREIGVRMALGATRLGILQMVMSEGFRLVATGMVLGFLAAIPIANLIGTQLYSVSAHDPLTYAIVSVALGGAALFASYFAARRAMHLDPMVALRTE